MGIATAIGGFFKGSGIVESLENVALEAIETSKEEAEAKALFVKTLDPNGAMRRQISQFVCKVYGFYLLTAFSLIVMHFFGVGDAEAAANAMQAITATFTPITAAFGGIVGSSFGVNMTNNWKDVKTS